MELDDAFPTQPKRFHRPSAQSYKFYKPPSAQSYKPSAPSWTPSYKPPTDELELFRISPPNTETTYPVNDFQTPSYKPSVPSYDSSSHKPPTYKPSAPSYEPPTYKPSVPSYDPSSHKLPTYKPSAPSWAPSYETQTYKPSAPSYEPPTYKPSTYKPSVPPNIETTYLYPATDFQPPPPSSLVPQDPHRDERLFGEIGLHCYNLLNGTNLEFLDLDKFFRTGMFHKRIKLNAYDPIRNVYREFMTRVVPSEIEKVYMRFITTQCRLLPDVGDYYPCDFSELAVDDFFKGDMPNSMPEDTSDNPQYYELKESEVEENKAWLRRYADLAFYTKLHYIPTSRVWRGPYNLTKVIVQTTEDVESEKKAKALNAIFYISIKTFRGQDCYATIRRTTDGMPGHMSLEVKCLM